MTGAMAFAWAAAIRRPRCNPTAHRPTPTAPMRRTTSNPTIKVRIAITILDGKFLATPKNLTHNAC
jgi:hypothetical protein